MILWMITFQQDEQHRALFCQSYPLCFWKFQVLFNLLSIALQRRVALTWQLYTKISAGQVYSELVLWCSCRTDISCPQESVNSAGFTHKVVLNHHYPLMVAWSTDDVWLGLAPLWHIPRNGFMKKWRVF